MMDERQAVAAFAALGQEHRLRIVRQLVTAGPDGMPAGMLAEAVGVSGDEPVVPSQGAFDIPGS